MVLIGHVIPKSLLWVTSLRTAVRRCNTVVIHGLEQLVLLANTALSWKPGLCNGTKDTFEKQVIEMMGCFRRKPDVSVTFLLL